MTVHQLSKKPPAGYGVHNRGNGRGEIFIYGPIGFSFFGDGITADQFRKDLAKLSNVSTIDVRINSDGGDVFAGQAMYSLLNQHPAKIIVHIDGLAASAASFIAMAGDEIEISEAAFVMIHEAVGIVRGRAGDIRSYADMVDKANDSIVAIYTARTGQDEKKVRKWMTDETWMTGKEAVTNKFADRMVANLAVAASARDAISHPEMFKNLPASLRPRRQQAAARLASVTLIK
jgi:ATP-dependent Clp protease protease subunit